MIAQEERESIINEAIEKALLVLPETIGNLMAQHAILSKINKKFYSDHPEFQAHKDAVMSIVEMIETKDPLAKYEDILKRSVPEIRKRIETMGKLDTNNVSTKPDRQFKKIEAPSDKNPHGVI